MLTLPWYCYLPPVGGVIGALIGNYYYKKYQDRNRKEIRK